MAKKPLPHPAPDEDSPEWTEADFASARPASELPADIQAAFPRMRGRPKSANPKEQVTLRISREVLEHFRSSGPGWQTEIDRALLASIRNPSEHRSEHPAKILKKARNQR